MKRLSNGEMQEKEGVGKAFRIPGENRLGVMGGLYGCNC